MENCIADLITKLDELEIEIEASDSPSKWKWFVSLADAKQSLIRAFTAPNQECCDIFFLKSKMLALSLRTKINLQVTLR